VSAVVYNTINGGAK